MNSRTRNRLLAAVAAAVPVIALSLPVSAQQRSNQTGGALDANNRVGSDGSNNRNNNVDARGYTGNQIVTGNVSGAKAFRGPLGYRDSLEFSGPSAGLQTDRFIRDSSGAPTRTAPMTDYGRATGFYGDNRSAPAPSSYRTDNFTGGMFNTGSSTQTVAGGNPYAQGTTWAGSNNSNTLLRPNSVLIDAGVDQNNQQQLLSASPLYGVLPVGSIDSQVGASGLGTDVFGGRRRDGSRLNAADRDRMRQELLDAGQVDAGDTNPNALSGQPLNNAVDATQGGSVDSARAGNAVGRNQGATDVNRSNQIQNQLGADRLQGNAGVQPGLQSATTVPPSKQSKQYAELESRFRARQSAGPLTPEEANIQQRMLRNAAQGQTPAGAAPAGVGGAAAPQRPALPITPKQAPAEAQPAPAEQPKPAQPDAAAPAPAAQPAAPGAEPLRIKSLAEGVDAQGLRELLTGAEELMKKGNYRSAIEKYNSAEQVAPNNPLIRLGRAQAELGAARYVSAETSLRAAVTANPELLMGQYDLESFIGRDRLSFLVKELQQISRTESGSARPMILLAYVAYGTQGMESAAADYLKQAADRAGRPDPLVQAMQKYWTLPAAEGAAPATPAEPAAQPVPETPAAPEDVNK